MASGAILFAKTSSVLTLRAECLLVTSKPAHLSPYLPVAQERQKHMGIGKNILTSYSQGENWAERISRYVSM